MSMQEERSTVFSDTVDLPNIARTTFRVAVTMAETATSSCAQISMQPPPLGVQVQIGAQGPKLCTRKSSGCGLKADHNYATYAAREENKERIERAKNLGSMQY